MIFNIPDFVPAYPEIFLLLALSAILIQDLWVSQENKFRTYLLTQLTLFVLLGILLSGITQPHILTFNDMFINDPLSRTLKLLSVVCLAFVLVYSRSYNERHNLFSGEFYVLCLFGLLGMMVMISANNFLVLYLGIELLSLTTCTLIALQRDSAVATEAAMKYFVLSALASGLLLYGFSMLYGATGTLQMAQVGNAINNGTIDPAILVFGLVFVIAGISFKLGVVPFHMWVPDVYEGASTGVTLFVSTAPKIAAFGFVYRILVGTLSPMVADWQTMLLIVSVLSMALGNITAIAQTNIKRMLAYSTISHMGYLLLGILSGTIGGFGAALFYVIAYVLMSLSAFGLILLLGRAGVEINDIEDLKGLNQKSPWFAFLMLLTMISMAGIPVSIGFFAKLSVLTAALDAGYTIWVIFAVMMSLVGAFFYLRILKTMYMDERDPAKDSTPLVMELDHKVLVSLNAFSLLILGVIPQPLIAWCAHTVQISMGG